MPHIPLHVSERFKGKSAAGLYGDVVQELDWSVGEVLATIRRLRLERDTVVIFSSDNGPWYQGSPGPLRGRKGSTYEGGVRVPGIVWGPGRVPARWISAEPVATIDVFPTALALAGESDPGTASQLPLDGKNILPLLTGQDKKSPHDLLLFFDGMYLQAARSGNWKLHVARWNIPRFTAASSQQRNVRLAIPELFDLKLDVAESYDVAAEHPDVVRDLQTRILTALKSFPKEIQQANADLGEKGKDVP
jgi:arylsulfatase A-like enzyme